MATLPRQGIIVAGAEGAIFAECCSCHTPTDHFDRRPAWVQGSEWGKDKHGRAVKRLVPVRVWVCKACWLKWTQAGDKSAPSRETGWQVLRRYER